MRWLILRLRREDRGAYSVMTAMLLVVMLGAVALAVDVGAMYAERTELQNGADAAALAVAQKCAVSETHCTTTAVTVADQYADRNAKDGLSDAQVVKLDTGANEIEIRATARDTAAGAGSLSLYFARALGIKEAKIAANASAGWSKFPAAGTSVLPLALSWCVFEGKLNGAVQLVQVHGQDTSECVSPSPSGQVVPGGFGWLADDGTCSAYVDVENPAQMTSDTGNNVTNPCKTVLAKNLNKVVLLPIYEGAFGTGATGTYAIKGWAGFKLMGWNFPGSADPDGVAHAYKCKGSCSGLVGQFVSYGSLGDGFDYTDDSAADLGTSVVTLTK